MKTVFVSYAREDVQHARRLVVELRRLGYEPWFDEADLVAGEDWRSRIREEIARTDFFVALISKHALNKRGFVQKETKLALDALDECPLGQIFLIPILLDESKPLNPRFNELNWLNLYPDYGLAIQKLHHALGGPKPELKRLVDPEPTIYAPDGEVIYSRKITGSCWKAITIEPSGHRESWEFELKPDGILRYTDDANWFEDATWEANGPTIQLYFPTGKCTLKGIVDGSQIVVGTGIGWEEKPFQWGARLRNEMPVDGLSDEMRSLMQRFGYTVLY